MLTVRPGTVPFFRFPFKKLSVNDAVQVVDDQIDDNDDQIDGDDDDGDDDDGDDDDDNLASVKKFFPRKPKTDLDNIFSVQTKMSSVLFRCGGRKLERSSEIQINWGSIGCRWRDQMLACCVFHHAK